MGGIKRLPDGACEIKRMYVVPQARGRGVARELLEALEEEARALGYELARLDTGPRQPHAERDVPRRRVRRDGQLQREPVCELLGGETAVTGADSTVRLRPPRLAS